MSRRTTISNPQELRIWLLGGFRAEVDGQAVTHTFRAKRRPASLLELLALTPGHALHREIVQDLLWPELDGDAAANNLHVTLHELRRLLEPDLQHGRCSAYVALQANVLTLRALWVDVEAFELAARLADAGDAARLEAAIALYSGDLLPEHPFDDWIVRRRDALHLCFLDHLHALASAYERSDQLMPAVHVLERLVQLEPTHERAATQLIELYRVLGQPQRALRLFRQLQRALACDDDDDVGLAFPSAQPVMPLRPVGAGRGLTHREH
jgi:DNA-binding SARP family transcriptional activator